MKKILMVLTALAIVSCQEQNSKVDNGTVPGIKDGTKIFVSTMGENNRPIPTDTAVVKNEAFTLDIPNSGTQTLNSLTVENIRGNVLFIKADQPISFTLHKDSLRSSVVEGGKHNALMSKYFDHLKDFGKKINNIRNQFQVSAQAGDSTKIEELKKQQKELFDQNTEFQKNIVKNNPESLISVMILSDMLRTKSLPLPEVKKLYESFSKEMKETPAGKQIKEIIEMSNATAIGSKAPGFSGPTPSGKTLSLEDAMGKITLVDFWASWCRPCRAENPNIVEVYKKYHDQGLNIIQVSLDKQKEKWIGAIEKDGLVWSHISHLKFWQDPIAKKYNVRAIPAAFLLDENGVIIAKDLRGQDLEDKVAELLGS